MRRTARSDRLPLRRPPPKEEVARHTPLEDTCGDQPVDEEQGDSKYLLVTFLKGGVTPHRSGGCGAPARATQEVVAKGKVPPEDYTWVCWLGRPPKEAASRTSAESGSSSSGSEASVPTAPGSPAESIAEG